MTRLTTVLAAELFATTALCGVALAEEGKKGASEVIVVTAQKRKEDVKDIPLSVSALSGAALDQAKIKDYDDLSRAVPGLNFNTQGSEGTTNIEIRGVSSSVGSATVGVFLDDVSLTVKNFFDGSTQPKLFDLDRVEVLRGPQGTIWGASSMGGAIRFVTKQPDLNKFSADITLDGSYTDHASFNHMEGVAINLPIVPDKFALRASFGYSYDSGWVTRYNHIGSPDIRTTAGGVIKKGTNDERAYFMRLTGKIIASDSLTITPAFFYQDDRVGDTGLYYKKLGQWNTDKQVVERGRDALFMPSLTVDYDLGFADLTSVSAYFRRQEDRQQDGTFYDSTVFAEFFVDPVYPAQAAKTDMLIGNIRSPVEWRQSYGQLSQEVRLASYPPAKGEMPLKWLVGAYGQDQYIQHLNIQTMPGVNTIFKQIFGVPMEQSKIETTYGSPGLVLFPGDQDIFDIVHYDERQYAVFGQFDYDLSPKLHASVGVRYSQARAVLDFDSGAFYNIGNPVPYHRIDDFYGFTPKYTLSYDVTPESNVYATAAQGMRFGGETQPIPFGPDSTCAQDDKNFNITSKPAKFVSDKLWSYELGSKNRFLDNKLSVDAAGYYMDWKNLQQLIFLPICGFPFTANVGNAEVYGGEFEIRYLPMEGLTLGLTGGYTHAQITATTNVATVAVGRYLIDVPQWTGTAIAEYDWPIASDITARVRADYSRQGHSHGDYHPENANYYNNSYGVLNASVGMSMPSYDLTLYVKNLTNDHTIIQSPEINTVVQAYTVRPLTVGVTAKAHF